MAPSRWGYRVMSRFADWAVIDLDAMVMTNMYGTTSSSIAVNGWGTVVVDGQTWPATTVKSAVSNATDVILMPRQDHFIALKVC
jgi:membrane protein implicated in regulation of membrane protease activity